MTTTTTRATSLESVLRRFIDASAAGDSETVGALVSDDVRGWSPTLNVSSRQELVDAFDDRVGVGALEDVDVTVTSVAVVRNRAIAEWRMSAFFRGELDLDGVTIPPTGRPVWLAGATFAEFEDHRVRSFRHYFDDAAMLEQLLATG
jgi:predicted ester cyclase